MASVDLGKKQVVDGLAPRDKTAIHYDSELKGFGVRVTPKGFKSWILEYRPRGAGRSVSPQRMTLGATSILSPKQARDEAKRLLAEIRLGADPAKKLGISRDMPTVRDFAKIFLADYAAEKLKKSTYQLYEDQLERLIIPRIGSMQIHNVTSADVAALHRNIARTGKNGKRREGAANRMLTTLSSLFQFAIMEQLLPNHSNPVRLVEKYSESFTPRYFSLEELGRIGEALTEGETIGLPRAMPSEPHRRKHCPKPENSRIVVDPFAAAAIRLLILSGARKGEILTLQWDHVDLALGLLILPDSKTGKKTIPLSEAAMEIISGLPRIGPYVIVGSTPDTHLKDVRSPYKAVLRRAGLKARLHDLRHTNASIGIAAGLSLAVIGSLLGHNSATTTKRYAHLADGPAKRAADLVGKTISPSLGSPRRSADD